VHFVNRLIKGVAAAGVLTLAATAVSATSAYATTGSATLTNTSNQTLNSGGSATPFQVATPAGAACTNTGPNGYQEAGFVMPVASPVQGATYNPQTTSYSGGGNLLYNASSQSFGPENPGAGGVLLASGALQFAPTFAAADFGLGAIGSTAQFNIGTLCFDTNPATNPNGPTSPVNQVVDSWSCLVTFTAVATTTDPNGYQWSTNCGSTGQLPEVPLAAAIPIGGIAVFGGAAYFARRRRTRPIAA